MSSPQDSLQETPHGTHLISVAGNRLELNLHPMNPRLPAGNEKEVRGMRVAADGLLNGGDLVGIVNLQLKDAPPVPRICWDNREHHFWNNLQGTFHLRNVVVNDPKVRLDESQGAVVAYYRFIADFIETRVEWTFPLEPADGSALSWDIRIEIENKTPKPLKGYTQLWANYHPAGENFYVDVSGAVTPCGPHAFHATADDEERVYLQGTPAYRHTLHYLKNRSDVWTQYAAPILTSQPRPWFGGKRHLTMVEPAGCRAMVTWMNQARDFLIGPPQVPLAPNEPFGVRIRHVIAEGEGNEFWRDHWERFQPNS